jgi:2-polyprenyl-3-methyl-5-hydroxy-6-metoxy-1,4-benzoquinol methylase|tara:strand:+ start:8268 stop:8942 length:675 start_codon:yes stop_codon:yes gene_type:complete
MSIDKRIDYLNHFQDKIDKDIYSEPKSQLHYSVIEPQAQNFLSQFKIQKDKSVIDIGCGDGYFLSLLQKNGFKDLAGVTKGKEDITNCVDKGIKKIYDTDMTFTHIKEKYDVLWCRHCLEHSPYPYLTLHEFNRLIKLNGHAYIEVPEAEGYVKHENNANHYSMLTKRNWVSLILRCGFDINRIQDIDLNIRNPEFQDGNPYPEQWWAFYLTKTIDLNFMKGVL